ncbi:helix-turn-helix domain-containing protein [Pseudonocardia hispaniensis]|uniref:Helix-turn-helix domain-containing protein n=1 Tax=Pseudonocardia hispaniensis TaxID=904933 RepID=A0ABW1IYY1_9PSEU
MTAPDTQRGSSWAVWLQNRLDERSWRQAELVNRSGGTVTRAQVSRWLKGGHVPDIASIRDVCEVLGVPAVEGMIAAGHLSPEDLGVSVIERHREARDLSKRELLAELDRRIPDDEAEPAPPPISIPRISPEGLGVEGEDFAARRRPNRDDR